MDFDYYQIKGKWNAATLNRRAEKLEEAQAAADELEEAGAKGVEIIGVKTGKRETIRGKKKAPAKKKKAAKRKKTAVKMTGTTGTYTTDYKTEKKAKAAAQNIRKLGYKTEIVEPAGQLDLFTGLPAEITGKRFKNYKIKFTNDELFEIVESYNYFTGIRNKKLEETIKEAQKLNKDVALDLSGNEIKNIIDSLRNYYGKYFFEDTIKLQKQLEKILQ